MAGRAPATPKGGPATQKLPTPVTPSHTPSTPSLPMPVTPSPSTPTAESFRHAVLWAASQPQFKDASIRTTPLPAAASAAAPKEPIRAKGGKLDPADVQLVQSYIEKCLQLYMNQAEVITALRVQFNIEPGFTALVWTKLEEQNPLFFRAYNLRLRIKEQISAFNYLVSQQAQLVSRQQPAPAPTANVVSVEHKRSGTSSVPNSPAFAALSNPLKALGPPSGSTTPIIGSTTPIIESSPSVHLNTAGGFPPPLSLPPSAGAPSLLSSATFPTLHGSAAHMPIPGMLRDSRGVLSLSNSAVPLNPLGVSNTEIPDLDTNQFFSLPEEKGT